MIGIGADHGGFDLKEKIVEHFKQNNISYKDFGIYENISCDYPDIAKLVANSITSNECIKGILVCGTGIGISIAANKIDGIRAACCSDTFSAKYTRLHNNANILCIGGRVVGDGVALELVDIFLNTEFEGGRHQTRIDKISKLESEKK